MKFYTFAGNILKGIDLTDCNPNTLKKVYENAKAECLLHSN